MKCQLNRGAKITVISFLLFALLVSPCFASAGWAGLMERLKAPTATSSQAQTQEVDSLELASQESSQPTEEITLEKLQQDLNVLKEDSTVSNDQETLAAIAEIEAGLAEIREALAALDTNDKVSTEYQKATFDSLQSALALNKKQADELAVAKKAAQTRPFVMMGAEYQYEDDDPQLALCGGLGARFGNNLMLMSELTYEMGDFTSPSFDLEKDNVSFGVKVGWMF